VAIDDLDCFTDPELEALHAVAFDRAGQLIDQMLAKLDEIAAGPGWSTPRSAELHAEHAVLNAACREQQDLMRRISARLADRAEARHG